MCFLINSCACFAPSKVLPFLFPSILVFWFPLHQLCFFLCWRIWSYGSAKVLVFWSGNTLRIVSLRFHQQSGDEFVFFFCSCEFFAPSVRACVFSYGIEWWLAFVMISLHCYFELVLVHLAISSAVKLRCEVCQGYIHIPVSSEIQHLFYLSRTRVLVLAPLWVAQKCGPTLSVM